MPWMSLNRKWQLFVDYADESGQRLFSIVMPILGKFLVLSALILIGLTSYLFEIYVLPELFHSLSKLSYVFLMLIGHWLLVNIIFNYYMAVRTDPGSPTIYTSAPKLCKRCGIPKPDRTHHCSVCERCILRMDHHCPWINNCVGFYNHRFFFLFCAYTTIGCLFTFLVGFFQYFPAVYSHDKRQYVRDAVSDSPLSLWRAFILPFMFGPPLTESAVALRQLSQGEWQFTATMVMTTISLVMFAVLLGFSLYHFYLISNNTTTIDSYSDDNYLFNMGFVLNWMQIFDACSRQQLFLRIILPCAALTRLDGGRNASPRQFSIV